MDPGREPDVFASPSGAKRTRSLGAARRYRTISRIWKIGMVAAGMATSGENAVVAMAIAVPLFLPVLAERDRHVLTHSPGPGADRAM